MPSTMTLQQKEAKTITQPQPPSGGMMEDEDGVDSFTWRDKEDGDELRDKLLDEDEKEEEGATDEDVRRRHEASGSVRAGLSVG